MADRCPIFCLPLLFSLVFRQLFRGISNDTAIFDTPPGKRRYAQYQNFLKLNLSSSVARVMRLALSPSMRKVSSRALTP